MREMKYSGVEWIGPMSSDWSVMRMKNCITQHDGGSWGNEKQGDSGDVICLRVADFDYSKLRFMDAEEYTFRNYDAAQIEKLKLRNGDILVEKSGGGEKTPVGRAVIFDKGFDALYANFLERIRVNHRVVPKFLLYVLSAFYGNGYIKNYIKQTTGIQNLDLSTMLASEFIAVPSIAVQQRIADYLDAKCAKIDTLIAKQQEIIEKLKAYKLSVITEAVTKGLNPNVPMKDSGIEWIGVIPEQWRLSHIGNLAEIGAGGTPDRKKPEYWENGTIRWMASGEINYEYVYDTTEKITELGMQNSNAKLLPVNTVMLGLIGQGKTKGMTAILKTECACNQNLAYLIPNPDLLHYGYLFYCFKAMYHYIRGLVGESQAGIYQDFLKKQHIPLPNIEVQAEICDYLDRVAAAIDIYVVRREEQMKKLVDYKKSLIYEVVTGKREV